MTSQEPMFEQLRDEFPGICVRESPTGRHEHRGIRFCGIKEKVPGDGECGFHQVPDAHRKIYETKAGRRLSRAEQELLLVLRQHKAGGPAPGALVQDLIDAGWRRADLRARDYDRDPG